MIDLSIIIVNYNTKDYLRRCLNSLYAQQCSFSWEVIVVDNYSHDGSVAMVQRDFPAVCCLANHKNAGFSRANNQGLKVAKGNQILLLNSDTKVMGNSLEKLLRFLTVHPEAAVVTGRLVYPDFSDQQVARTFPTPLNALFGRKTVLTRLFPRNRYSRKFLVSHMQTAVRPFEVDWVSGACLMVRREIIAEVGFLDERFWMYWEDADFCLRIKNKGWKVYCVPEAIVIHYESKSVTRKVKNRSIIEFNKSVYHYYRKHYIRSRLSIMHVTAILGLSLRTMAQLGINTVKGLVINGDNK